MTEIVDRDRSTTVAIVIDGVDLRSVSGDDHRAEVDDLRIDAARRRKSTETNGSGSGSRITIGTGNATGIAIGTEGEIGASAIATEGAGTGPVRTVRADPGLIQDRLLINVGSLRNGVQGARIENAVPEADRNRSTIEDTVNTTRIEERTVAMNIVANTETTEKDHRDTTLIIKGIHQEKHLVHTWDILANRKPWPITSSHRNQFRFNNRLP